MKRLSILMYLVHSVLFLLIGLPEVSAQSPGFTENRGQIVDTEGKSRADIRFTASSSHTEYYFMNDKVVTIEATQERDKETSLLKTAVFTKKDILFKNFPAFKNTSVHTLSSANIRFEDPLAVKSNYYLPHCPDGITGVRSFKRVVYENIVENADLVFEISGNGNIESFLKDNTAKRKTSLSLLSPQSDTPNYINDPKVLYASYLGGNRRETGGSGASDSKSNFWVVGSTVSDDFPTTDSALERTKTASSVIYISKFSTTGELLYSTLYSGANNGLGYSVAVDSEDNPVITGYVSGINFPVSDSAFQKTGKGLEDAFIIKLDEKGKRVWATLFGGSGTDYASSVAIDKQDNIIIAGETASQSGPLPTTPDAFQPKYGGGQSDAFIAKFDKAGHRVWATYFGGSDNYRTQRPFGGDQANWVTTDSGDNIIITGTARTAVNFPTTEGAFQKDSSFMDDAFLAKFSPDGQRLWATLYGGTGPWTTAHPATEDEGKSVAVDRDNNIIMGGVTLGADFPVTDDAYVKEMAEGGSGFLVKFSPQGNRIWATYFANGSGAIKTDDSGKIYIAGGGVIDRNGFIQTEGAITMPGMVEGGMSLTIFKEQQIQYSTLYPVFTGGQEPHNIALAPNGNIALFGHTSDGNFPVTYNALVPISGTDSRARAKSFIIILHNITTDIKEDRPFKNNAFSIQPNPANNRITLTLPEEFEEAFITVTSILGQEVLKTHFKNNQIDISLLPDGMFIVRADVHGKTFTSGFVKY